MDCLQAQEIISAALENAVPDNDVLEAAKAHCRTCSDCNTFVKTLVAIKNTPPPEPPVDLNERIMAAVAVERERLESEQAALIEARAEDEAATAVMPAVTQTTDVIPIPANPRVSVNRGPAGQKNLILWVATAAVVLVAAGAGSVLGIRAMFGGNTARDVTLLESTAADQGAAGTGEAAPPGGTSADTLMAPQQDSRTASGAFIAVGGSVYRAAGTDATVSEESLTQVGSTTTSLISGAIPREEPVLGAGDPARVFMASANNVMLAFDRVTTSFEGRTYVLQSDDIAEYGSLATLPDDIAEPTSTDGFPAFEALNDGASGIYVRRGQSPSDGIAFPPGSKPDVSTGWTWWEPAQQ